MKESYREYLASNSGLEPYAGDGNMAGVASVRGNAGQPLSSDITIFACRLRSLVGKATRFRPLKGKDGTDAAESKNLSMRRHSKRENRENLLVPAVGGGRCATRRDGQRTFQTVMLT